MASAPEGPAYAKPLPQPTPDSAGFWEACHRHSLELQRCRDCSRFWFPPANRCAHCLSDSWTWTPVSGRGQLVTFTIMRRAYHPGFAEDVPYVVGVIELDEGPRLVSNVVGLAGSEPVVGMRLGVVFEDVAPEASLPKFRPCGRE